jgi:hypothetical protein
MPRFRIWRKRIFASRGRLIAASLLAVAASSIGLWAGLQSSPQSPTQMAAMLPQGALLTIESQDFATLLNQWNHSPQKAAWMKSDNYSEFSNSRLFGRLGDAQKEFAQAAGVPADKIGSDFLKQVAGTESVFAWYDIGKLEFLYITRLTPGAAEQNPLMQMRDRFSARQAAGQTFYVRTQADSPGQDSQFMQPRTVAFATSSDWLLLATREDLMAGALTLMASNAGNSGTVTSVAAEPWFVDASAAAAKKTGELRMTLNLEKIVPSPYFRSYWIQRNITEMKQYRSAVADLFTQAGDFREERVLLPKTPAADAVLTPSLAGLTALLPQHTGVFQAEAAPGVEAVLRSLDEKLLQRAPSTFADPFQAPQANLEVPEVGSSSDFETRIDTPPLALPAKGADLAPLRQDLANSGLDAMLTLSRTGEAADGIWVPFQSAIVLSSTRDWDAAQMQTALQTALAARLTASDLGLEWKPVKVKTGTYFEIGETRHLEIAARGKLCILTDDPGLMQEILERSAGSGRDRKPSRQSGEAAQDAGASLIAGFDLAQERSNFGRWSALVDRTNPGAGSSDGGAVAAQGSPRFFSQNIRSLGDSFKGLKSERVVERRDENVTRQTVTYAWQQ